MGGQYTAVCQSCLMQVKQLPSCESGAVRCGADRWQDLLADRLFSQGRETLPEDAAMAALIAVCGTGKRCDLAGAAAKAKLASVAAVQATSLLVKMGILEVVQ